MKRKDIEEARRLRRQMSPPEVALWAVLRRRPGGFQYRRQHPVGPYKLDFFCREAALAIEVDGDAHDMGDRPVHDERRDLWLAAKGIKTLRFLARDVMEDMEAVLAQVVEESASRCPSTALRAVPLPAKSRGGFSTSHRCRSALARSV